jgi:TonB-dependent SusC/RagA subfamily outer membrane receptor
MDINGQTEEDADVKKIREAEQQVAETKGVEKALWESITAQFYWNYYQQHRYKILDRTTLSETTSDDFATWDATAFFQKIAALYLASVSERKTLQDIPVDRYAPVIREGENTRMLRPTLYDLLVFRAIDYFQNKEKDAVQPASHFEMEGGQWFSPPARFSTLELHLEDTTSLHFMALKLYQEAIAFHLKDKTPEALIDADLQRLDFVFENSVHPKKDSLYLAALQNLEQKYSGNPAVAEVSFRIAQKQLGSANGGGIQPYFRPQAVPAKEKANRNIPAVKKKLQEIIAQYPKTEGGIHAYNLLQNIESKSVSIQSEEVYLPGENSKVLLSYQNLDKVYLKILHIPNTINVPGYKDTEDRLRKIAALNPIRSWSQGLPGSEDMEQHSAELKMDALPAGRYVLVASLNTNLKDSENIVASTEFQVSGLSLISREDEDKHTLFWALNRKDGQPIAKAHFIFWDNEYNRQKRQYDWKKTAEKQSGEDGAVNYSRDMDGSYRVMVVAGTDTFCPSRSVYYDTYDPGEKDNQHTFFFTDRSIYRPGQTIYFKGIIVKNSEKGRKNEVVPGTKTTITFYDVNSQKIHSLDLTTNDFGSFSGSFTAPTSGLTGMMSIENEDGSTSVSVEEYKRPKFYVEFDTLKGDFSLNQTVHIKGFAKAYAGNNIDGATVQYRVVRNARFPYYWAFYRWGMPASPEMEISHGTATTAADGSFELNFQTMPDRSIDPKSLPVFTYTVYADVTDINGETRSGQEDLNAGYRSLQITMEIPEESQPAGLDTIRASSRNLNDVFVPASLKMTIAPLQFPGKIYRKRLWPEPDQFVMTETEFHQAFPDDEYKNESDYHFWPEEKAVFEKSFISTANGNISIPENIWKKEGWYVISLSGKDAQGNPVEEKEYTYVSLPQQNGTAEKPFVVTVSKDAYEPGEEAKVWLKTGFKNVYILQNSSLPDDKKAGQLSGKVLDKTITEADRGGIGFSWLYVYNNRVYTTSRTLDIPWSNKDLQLEWATHRDKVLPGAKETWTLTIKGDKKEKVAAELLAGMYDASLDAFKPHQWEWDKLLPESDFDKDWTDFGFNIAYGNVLKTWSNEENKSYEKRYDQLDIPGSVVHLSHLMIRGIGTLSATKAPLVFVNGKPVSSDELKNINPKDVASLAILKDKSAASLYGSRGGNGVILVNTQEKSEEEKSPPPIRKNLRETAFFFPQLQTGPEGNIKFTFTLPEALTTWKFMAFAHTKDWKTGYLEGKIKTQKDLMVLPDLPRFLRQGDDITISTKISNLSDKDLSGTATLEILNAQTLQPLNLSFRLKDGDREFTIAQKQSATANWTVHVPESIYTPVILRITAKSGNFTDGEENALPVITNRILVTETLPLPIRGTGTKTFSFDKLKNSNSLMDLDKGGLVQHALTVEFTGNPAWYAVQALPYLVEYPYECAEQTFNRFYANALAAHIVAQSPKVEAIFKQWKNEDTAALLSNLDKNQELKSALLEETPWVMEAKDETTQKHRIAQLFEAHKLAKNLKNNVRKLEQMQLPQGGFPWFKGMYSDRYITQYIITGIARLQHLGVEAANDKTTGKILEQALPFLDEKIQEDYDNLLKNKADLSKQHIGYTQIQYLYMRSFFKGRPVPKAAEKAFDFYKKQAAQFWNKFNPYMKGMIALALNRLNDTKTAQQIVASLKETAIHNEETGMYWKSMPHGYWWYQAPIEAHSLLIETFAEVAKDQKAVDELKTWLLKQKQTQNWGTTKATADAVYALLLNGSDWLSNNPEVTIQMGDKTIKSTEIKTESGTGYFKQRIEGKDVKPAMGNITVSLQNPESKIKNPVAWGAVYWQYFEDMDKVTSAETPLSLKKQLFIERNTDKGPVLTEIKTGNELKVGDKVKVRIVLKVDRDMEYVHLKDMRAACFEPVNVLSGYKYQGGLGYYESTRDVSTNFFFDHLPKGTYVFEYPVFVSQQGDFSNGIATIQCMYAPEFSSHSKGIRVQVK